MRLLLLPILLPAAMLFALVSFIRARLYDFGVLPSFSVNPKVICVGNLTSGGTGKTPLIRWLALEVSRRGKRVCILSRGYKRSSEKILKVNPVSAEVSKYGDEPLQLAKQLKGISVYVGANRLQAARHIVAEENPDVILLDDGFQHRRLKRDLDFVVMDMTQPRWHYWPLPLGFAREGRWALKRASAILLTKVNLSSGSEVEALGLNAAKVLQFTSTLTHARTLDGEICGLELLRGQKAALLTAIGRPENFEKQVRDLGIEVVFHSKFPDHHRFRAWEVQAFLKRCEKKGADKILVTEKDAVKLASFSIPRDKFLVVELEVNLTKGREEFDQLIHRVFT